MTISYQLAGAPLERCRHLIMWGHGWGQDHTAFNHIVSGMGSVTHLLIDLPGFGLSPPPPTVWGTAEYADACAALRASLPSTEKTTWIGHSFGGRIGLQLAARHPALIDGMCLIAAAGIPPQRPLWKRWSIKSRIIAYKLIKKAALRLGANQESLAQLATAFGSRDYQSAGALRNVFVKVVNENLSASAIAVRCPTLLLYGELDSETPPKIGEQLAKLISNSELNVLPAHDHYSLLDSGRHLVLKRIVKFLEKYD